MMNIPQTQTLSPGDRLRSYDYGPVTFVALTKQHNRILVRTESGAEYSVDVRDIR